MVKKSERTLRMNWLQKLSQSNIRVDMNKYIQSMSQYLYDFAERTIDTSEKLKNFKLNPSLILMGLKNYPNINGIREALNTNNKDFFEQEFVPITRWIRSNDGPERDQAYNAYIHLRDYMDSSDPFVYTKEEVQKDIQRLTNETLEKMNILVNLINEAIQRIPDWNASPITIEPKEPTDENGTNWLYPAEDANVMVGEEITEGRREMLAPIFEVFIENGKPVIPPEGTVEDDEFFQNPNYTRDYFSIIREINKPGSSQQAGKTLTLYTARPKKDREFYMSATTVPGGIWLTSNENNAVDLSVDFGGERDIWKIRIDERYVQKALDVPQYKHYQVLGRDPVPVKSITFFYEV